MKIYVIQYILYPETLLEDCAYRTCAAAVQAAKDAAEQVKEDTYGDNDVAIQVNGELVYFIIEGKASEEQWQVREIELIEG